MKEIKFRAWDIQNERMVFDPDRFEPSYLEEEKSVSPWVFYETWQDREDGIRRSCHVMMFTGLKDKNGKEIYECDIITAWVSRFPDSKTPGVVCWNNHVAAFQLQYEGAFNNFPTDFLHKWHHFEILGNIYEHPELLKSNV